MPNSKSLSLLPGLAMGAAMLASSSTPSGAQAFPSIGNDSSGPQLLITLNSNGTATVSNGPGSAQGPFDGSDDAYIGVINNTGHTVNALTLHGTVTSNGGIF